LKELLQRVALFAYPSIFGPSQKMVNYFETQSSSLKFDRRKEVRNIIVTKIRPMATIFSRIIKGEIPCFKIAEDNHYFAFLDIHPLAKGHTLVVPKQETDYLFHLEDDLLAGLVVFAKKVALAIEKTIP